MEDIKFFVDTFSWKKIGVLEHSGLIDLNTLYNKVNICITHEILKEVNHFGLEACRKEEISIFPTQKNQIYTDAENLNFDEADASLLSNLLGKKCHFGVSEDHPLLKFGRSYRLNIFQLIDFFQFQTAINVISKNQLFQINKKLGEMHNISEKKEKKIKYWLRTN